jgi:FHA domain
VNASVGRQGLWSLPGDGVLARQGDLILLSAVDERGLLDNLLDLLAKTSDVGGDGRRFVDAVEDLIEGDETWGAGDEGEPGPAVIAFGPAGAGLAVTVSGTAWAEITTAHGTDRLVAAQPATVLRCVVGIPVYAVRGGLGVGRSGGDRTDRFSHLERGTIRAGGLSYHSGLTATPTAAAPPPGVAASEAVPPPVPDVTALDVAGPEPAAADAGAPAPAVEEAGAWEQPYPVEPPAAQPAGGESPAAWAEAAEPHVAEPAVVEPEVAERAASEPEVLETEAFEPEAFEPEAFEPEAFEPEAFEPEAMEPTALPEADQFHPPTEKSQVPDHPPTGKSQIPDHPPTGKSQIPDFPTALDEEQPAAAVPVREATGAAELPPLSSGEATPVDDADAAAGAPIVLGVYCKNGHFGDPNARSCVVCGVSRGRRGPAPQPGPRPPLGALVLDDNSALELSIDCVVGREPALDPSVAVGEAHPLAIADAAVSRVHARIHLDGWQVLLIDLGSVNGTRIRLPGKRSEQALEPNVPVPLQSGTRVLVGTQGFQYEAHRGR